MRLSEVYCLLLESSQHSVALVLPKAPGKTIVKKKKIVLDFNKIEPQWKSRQGEAQIRVAETLAQWGKEAVTSLNVGNISSAHHSSGPTVGGNVFRPK